MSNSIRTFMESHKAGSPAKKAVNANIVFNPANKTIGVNSQHFELSENQIAGFVSAGVFMLFDKTLTKTSADRASVGEHIRAGYCGKLGDNSKQDNSELPTTIADLPVETLSRVIASSTIKIELDSAAIISGGHLDKLPKKIINELQAIVDTAEETQGYLRLVTEYFLISNTAITHMSATEIEYSCRIKFSASGRVMKMIAETKGWNIANNSITAEGDYMQFSLIWNRSPLPVED